MPITIEPTDRISVIDGVKAPFGRYLRGAASAGVSHGGEACIDWPKIGVILMVAASAFLLLRPSRMSLSFEVNGREKHCSFNRIAFWILLIGGAVLVAWHPAGIIGHG
jgi:hypothetical protein